MSISGCDVMNSLFKNNFEEVKPLAVRLRPTTFEEFISQEKLLGKHGILKKLIENQSLSNCIFYGPPGCGKTTLMESAPAATAA